MALFREFRRRHLSFLPTPEAHRRFRGRVLRRFGLARCREPRLLSRRPELRVDDLIGLVAAGQLAEHGELTFLQVGAYDGRLGDQLRELLERHACRGVLVEPQPVAFERLQATYADRPELKLVNAAIDRVAGERDFYMPTCRDSVVSSFDRGHLLKHGVPADAIIAQKMRCLTVDEVLADSGLERIDLVLIDAEGHDAAILDSIDLERWRPAIVRFEYSHLSQADADRCLTRLADHGYRFVVERYDLIAIRSEPAAAARVAA